MVVNMLELQKIYVTVQGIIDYINQTQCMSSQVTTNTTLKQTTSILKEQTNKKIIITKSSYLKLCIG